MKFVSWNVNGLRACITKGFEDFFRSEDADFFCIQETKLQPEQLTFKPEGWHIFLSSAVKKGYSGTAIYTKHEPLSVAYGINGEHNDEGRVITLEYPRFYLVNCYIPNAQHGLARIDYRMEFEDAMRAYLSELSSKKPLVYTGDLNVAHNPIDLARPKDNVGNAGYSDEERGKMTELLAAGFTDSFRYLYPERTEAYTWWSYRMNARERNIGWRIDYFIVSNAIAERIKDSTIYADVLGSDHCPVGLDILL